MNGLEKRTQTSTGGKEHWQSQCHPPDPTPIGAGDVQLYRCENGDFGADWLKCIHSREKPLCNEVVGYRSGSLCQLLAISDRLQRPLRYDPERVEFIGDEEANRLLDYAKRAPWRIC